MTFRKSDDPKDHLITLRVTAGQKQEIEAAATARMLSTSEFMLRRALGKPAPLQYEYKAIDTLAKTVLILKRLHRESGGANEGALQALLDECVTAIRELWRQRGRS